MISLSDRLDAYAALSPDERAALARDVAASGSPDDAAALAEAQAFARVLDAAARPGGAVSEDDLAAYLADRALGLDPHDAAHIEAALASDAGLRARADAMQARLDALDAETEPHDARFERLFGTSPDEAPAEEIRALRTPARRAPAERPAAAPPRARRGMMTRALAVLGALVVVAYGGLYAAGPRLTTSPEERTRLATADIGDLASYTPLTTRGDATDPLAERLDTALDDVADARRTTLGLFPHVDEARLSAAAQEIAAIIGATDASTSVSQEARFALARIRLAQHRDADARRLLGALILEQSYRAPEARRLLDFIRTQS